MAKKRNNIPEPYSGTGYTVWSVMRTIREAENISRWNPWLAHAWMNEARDQIDLDRPFYSEFDAAVERINAQWMRMRFYRWFDESDFWSYNGEPRSMTLLDPI